MQFISILHLPLQFIIMSIERDLQKRSSSVCEICGDDQDCAAYAVPQSPGNKLQHHAWLCSTCRSQLDKPETADPIRWRMLKDSIWSEIPAVKVLSWRMLHKLRHLDWVPDLIEIAYLEEDVLEWARASGDDKNPEDAVIHLDSNGNVLHEGDNVVLIKSLDVKGATFSAKLGTVVKKIKLVADNAEQIEGRVEGSQIVILTKYVRKV